MAGKAENSDRPVVPIPQKNHKNDRFNIFSGKRYACQAIIMVQISKFVSISCYKGLSYHERINYNPADPTGPADTDGKRFCD
jgi:hypothetical protein